MRKITIIFLTFMSLFVILHSKAYAEKKKDFNGKVIGGYANQANRVCNSILPTWIKSRSGMRSRSLRRLVADCYLAQARLTSIGGKSNLLQKPLHLDEIPMLLLERESGLLFDLYAPLVGIQLRVGNKGRSGDE